MSHHKLTPKKIRRAVKIALQILDPVSKRNFAEVLKNRAHLDVEEIASLGQVAAFEELTRVIFGAGAEILIRKLHAEFEQPVIRERKQMARTIVHPPFAPRLMIQA